MSKRAFDMPSTDNILPYLPRALVRSVFKTRATDSVLATALSTDVVGFTEMSRELSREGKEGAEELTTILNRYLATLIDSIVAYGGDILLFGGDALMAVFDGEGHALRAARCGLEIQEHVSESGRVETSQGAFDIGLHVGISSGELLLARVGGRDRRHLLIRGELLESLCAAEEASGAGDVVVSDQTVRLLGEDASVSPCPELATLHRLTGLSQRAGSWRASDAGSELFIDDDVLRALVPYLPHQIRNRIGTGSLDEGEHRPVVILFAGYRDVDALGDDHTRDTLFETIDSCVEGFGGTLVRDDFTASGPRFLVLFGAPQALEDAAFEAVQCALNLHERIPDSFQLRAAVSYGQVFAGEVGADSRKEYTVIGDAINLAARLAERAKASEILIDSAVYESIHDRVDSETCDPILAKGIETPVQTFRILNVARATEPSTGLLSLIGRDAEIAQMRGALQKAIGGDGQIVTVVGEAGIGKTRLVQELIEEARKADVFTVVGRCQIHSATRPYASWTEILESLLDIGSGSVEDRTDHIESILEKIEPGYGRWSPVLSDALSFTIPDSDLTRSLPPEERQPRLYRIVTDFLSTRAQQGPLTVVFEDAHWMDVSSQELMLYLASQIEGTPILMVVSSRPDLDLDSYSGYAHHLSLNLEELDESASLSLFAQTMGLEDISDQLNDLVRDQAKGNPLFVQGVAKSLLETDMVTRDVLTGEYQLDTTQPDWVVPDNLNELILSRLDRLSESRRDLLREASVIGSVFDVSMLYTITSHPVSEQDLQGELNALIDGGFLTVGKEGDVYGFSHALVQEAAYETLPYVRRREFQCEIAEELERRHSVDLEPVYDQLAHHYLHSDRRDKALAYCEKAGDRARERYINKAAIDYYSTAIDLSQGVDRASLHLKRARVWSRVGEYGRSISDAEEAAGTAEENNDYQLLYEAMNALWASHQSLGDPEAARTSGQRALEAAEKTDCAEYRVRGALALASLDVEGNREGVKATFEDGLREARALEDTEAICAALYGLGRLARIEGKPQEAIQIWLEVLKIRRSEGSVRSVASALGNLSMTEISVGDYKAAQDHASESLEINRRLGLINGVASGLQRMVRLKKIRGDLEGAREDLIERLRIHREIGAKVGIAEALNNLGLIDLEMGNTREAMPRIIQAIELEEGMGSLYSKANFMCNLGRGFRLDGDLDRAETAYAEALLILEEIDSRQEALAESLTGLATIDIDRTHLAKAKNRLRSALNIAVEGSQAEETVRALTQFGRLAYAEGDPERAAMFLIQVDVQNRNTFTTWGPEVKEGQDLLGQIEKEMEVEAFGKVKGRAEAMSLEEVVELAREMVVVKPEKQQE